MAISLISYFASRRRKRRTGRLRRRIQSSVAEDSSEKSLFFVAFNEKLGSYCYKFPQIFDDDDDDITRRRKRKRKRFCRCCTNHPHHHHSQYFNRRVLEPLADGCGFRIDRLSIYVAVGSIIYCIGRYRGSRSKSPMCTILYFDMTCPESGWRIGSPMIKSREYHPLVVAIDGKLYVLGGGKDPWGEVFDPRRDKWEALPEPPIRLEKLIYAVVVDQQGTKTLVMVTKHGKLYGYNVSTTSWDLLFVDKSLSVRSLYRIKVSGPAVVLDKTLYWYTKKSKHKIEAYDLEESMWFTGIVEGLEWDGLVTPPDDPCDHEHYSYPKLLHIQQNLWCLVWEDHRAYKDYSSGSTYRCIDFIKFIITKRINSRGYGELDIQIQSSQMHLIHPSLCFENAFFM